MSTFALLIREHRFIFNDILTVSVLVGNNFRFANDITLNNKGVNSIYIYIYLFFLVSNYLSRKKGDVRKFSYSTFNIVSTFFRYILGFFSKCRNRYLV